MLSEHKNNYWKQTNNPDSGFKSLEMAVFHCTSLKEKYENCLISGEIAFCAMNCNDTPILMAVTDLTLL